MLLAANRTDFLERRTDNRTYTLLTAAYVGSRTAQIKHEVILDGQLVTCRISHSKLSRILADYIGPLPSETDWVFDACTEKLYSNRGMASNIADGSGLGVSHRQDDFAELINHWMTEAAKLKCLREYEKAMAQTTYGHWPEVNLPTLQYIDTVIRNCGEICPVIEAGDVPEFDVVYAGQDAQCTCACR